MAKQKETKQSTIQRLFVYAEKYKYFELRQIMQMQKICRLMDGVRLDLRYCPCLSISEL